MTKGLIAPVFFLGGVVPYLLITGQWRRWREFHLLTGILLFLAIGAPWHILAGLHNPDQGHPVGNIPSPGNVHGFFYFYFINEHVLRFLGKRYPHDYNKLPGYLVLEPASGVAVFRGASTGRRLSIPPGANTAPAASRRLGSTVSNSILAKIHAAAGTLCSLYSAVLFALHKPGILHLPGVSSAAAADRHGAGET